MKNFEHPISDTQKRFSSFVKTIAYNERSNYLRERKMETLADNAAEISSHIYYNVELDLIKSPNNHFLLGELFEDERIARAVDGLSDIHKYVLFYSYCIGLSENEIARLLGKARRSINWLKHDALRQIRRRVQYESIE